MSPAIRIAIFCDVQSLWFAAKLWDEKRIDYAALGKLVRDGRSVEVCTAFLVDREGIEKFERALSHMGYDTAVSTRNHIEPMMEAAMLIAADKVDVVVVVTGQGRYQDVFREIRSRGKQVELWTCPIDCNANDLAADVDAHRMLDQTVLKAEEARA